MKKRYFILVLGILILVVVYFTYSDSFPPRTPLKVARLVSGLNIANETEFEMLEDDWAPNGDGTTYVKAKLTDKQLRELIEQAIQKKYENLPIKVFSSDVHIPLNIIEGKQGYYLLEVDKDDPRDYTLTIIDSDKKEMIAYIWYM